MSHATHHLRPIKPIHPTQQIKELTPTKMKLIVVGVFAAVLIPIGIFITLITADNYNAYNNPVTETCLITSAKGSYYIQNTGRSGHRHPYFIIKSEAVNGSNDKCGTMYVPPLDLRIAINVGHIYELKIADSISSRNIIGIKDLGHQ